MINFDSETAKRALVSLAIETALLEIGNAMVEEVGNRLYAKHKCYFMDCLEHPEYLKDVLNQVFGRSHDSIIKSIEKNLAEFANQRPIAEFLAAMSE